MSAESQRFASFAAISRALAGHETNGLRVIDLAQGLRLLPSTTHRTLQAMIAVGFAEQLDDEKYRLGPAFVQIAVAHAEGLAKAEIRIAEIKNRFSRTPN